jgi:uncharacterized membrane protein
MFYNNSYKKRGDHLKKLYAGLLVIGIIFLIIAPIWMFIIAPSQLIVPEDVDESVTYTGTASMANPMDLTQLAGPFDLTINRSYEGIDTAKDDEVVIINEKATVKIDNPMVPVEEETFLMAVDRKTCEHLNEDGDSWDYARSGQFTFGFHPEKKDTEFWLHDINDTVIAKYEGTTTYEGINVIEFSMKEDMPVTKNQDLINKYAGLAYYYGGNVLNSLMFKEYSTVYVDETSGMIVYIDRNTEFYGEVFSPAANASQTVTFAKMSYKFDEETSEQLIEDAKDADYSMQMFENNIPLIFALIGIVFVILGIVLNVRSKKANKPESEEINTNEGK